MCSRAWRGGPQGEGGYRDGASGTVGGDERRPWCGVHAALVAAGPLVAALPAWALDASSQYAADARVGLEDSEVVRTGADQAVTVLGTVAFLLLISLTVGVVYLSYREWIDNKKAAREERGLDRNSGGLSGLMNPEGNSAFDERDPNYDPNAGAVGGREDFWADDDYDPQAPVFSKPKGFASSKKRSGGAKR